MTNRIQRATIVAGLLVVGALGALLACGGGEITVNPPTPPRTVTVLGSGSGRVTSADGKVDCKVTGGATSGSKCSASYDSGAVVSLTATPDVDQEFKAWSGGDCSGTSTCQLTVTRDMTASAGFVRAVEALLLEFTTPENDDGAAIIKIEGPSILGIVGTSGVEVAASPEGNTSTTSKTVMVRGNLTTAAIARVNIRGIHLGDPSYTATVKSVAARKPSYVLRGSLGAYRATLKP